MQSEDRCPANDARYRHLNVVIESTRALDRRINGVDTIRGTDYDHPSTLLDPIEKRQQLRDQRDFILVYHPTAVRRYRIKLVNQHDARRRGSSASENPPYILFTLADPFGQNLRPTDDFQMRVGL